SLGAELRHELRNVDGKLVRRRVLAGVVTVPAIEAQISQIGQIGFCERPPPFHRWENRAVAFAVTASISNTHLPLAVFEEFRIGHIALLLFPLSVRTPNRS